MSSPVPNWRRRSPQRTAMVSALRPTARPAPAMEIRPCTSAPIIVKKRAPGELIDEVYSPSSVTWPYRSSSASRGTRTALKRSRPLSTPCRPILSPQSSTSTPSSSRPCSSRTGTTKACTPRASPATSSWANTTATRPCRAALPIQSLRASSSGVCRTNSCAAASYRAWVRMLRTSLPWPLSLIAKQPGSSSAATSRHVGLVVPLGAEPVHRAAEQAELHADLHQQRQVAVRERLEAGDAARPGRPRRRARAGRSVPRRPSRPARAAR